MTNNQQQHFTFSAASGTYVAGGESERNNLLLALQWINEHWRLSQLLNFSVVVLTFMYLIFILGEINQQNEIMPEEIFTKNDGRKTASFTQYNKTNLPHSNEFDYGQNHCLYHFSPNNTPKKSENLTLPNVLIAGAQKSATTAISIWLGSPNIKNRGVCQAQVFEGEPEWYKKEVHFFDDDERYSQCVGFLARRFHHCFAVPNPSYPARMNGNGKILAMDATPDTLRYPQRVYDTYQAAGQLHQLKIIFSLREPVSRDLSWFNHIKADSLETNATLGGKMGVFVRKAYNRTYDQYVEQVTIPAILGEISDDNVENGLYVKYLKTWFELFPRNHILILSFDEIRQNATTTRDRIERFLGESFPINKRNWKLWNTKHYAEKISKPSCRAQQLLHGAFRPYNELLYKLLDTTIDWPIMEEHPFPRFELGPCHP